ncbi:hypothetical protein HK102_009432, partial [Quaeritorhiza haematococci]
MIDTSDSDGWNPHSDQENVQNDHYDVPDSDDDDDFDPRPQTAGRKRGIRDRDEDDEDFEMDRAKPAK